MSAEATVVMASVPMPPSESMLLLPHSHDHDHDHDDCHHNQPEVKIACEPADDAGRHISPKPIGLHSPPDSNSAMKLDGSDDSELSDVEDPTFEPDQEPPVYTQTSAQQDAQDEDIGEVTPDHWSGTVPVFKPDMHQFKDFKKFMEKIDCYGMKSGIVKIIPPQEWKDKLPALDDLVKQVRVREPIKQDIMGSNGTYRQVNILHQRSYNLPQWRQLCDQSEHQPPARRGERRAQAPPKPKAASASTSTGSKRRGAGSSGVGRSTRNRNRKGGAKDSAAEQDERPMTPVSPKPAEVLVNSVEQDPGADIEDDDDAPPAVSRMSGTRQAKPKEQSTSARRKYARREGSARVDEEAFKDFDYRMDISDYTPERCEELERIYWKTLTYAPPLYGADVLGTLFNDSTESWNLNKLPNLLDVLGTRVPGVNTAYLYLGMWKATFAWHLEDVDLYSINYLHFGAPKQWYSISQGDARRFEAAMKSIWPTDAKACDQFLRHKAFLISPNHLQQYFNIKVNKCVSYPGEFVVTYPYGYHSGYNLGYNCAEAVNFALDSWLPMGKIAKKCECAQAQDSVWIDVCAIERKLRGEETDYEETEDEEDEDDEDELETGIPTPRSSHTIKFQSAERKRKRSTVEKGEKKAKKIRLRVKSHVEPPCCLCPHDIPGAELLPTEDDRKAHRLCALYGAETWIETVNDKEIVANVASISKARLDLKCLFCRSKRGVCFQCSHKKCARSYHATCAAAAGVLVEEAEVPIFGEDGTEYKEQAFEFSCRFHRTKRDRKLDGNTLDDCQKTRQVAVTLKKGDICQLQYFRGDIFAGIIVENRVDEQNFLLDIIPNGYETRTKLSNVRPLMTSRDRVEVEWKWLLLPDPADLHLPHASPNAIPMPTSRKAKEIINATRKRIEEPPRPEEPFVEGGFTWAEFNHHDVETSKAQVKVDLSKENQIWYYLGKNSTDARPQYTEDPKKSQHNCKSNFLDSVPKPPPPPPHPRKSYGSTFSIHTSAPGPKSEKPYQYKPRDPVPPAYVRSPFTAQQFVPKPPHNAQQLPPKGSPYNTFFHHTPQPASKLLNHSTPQQPVSIPPPSPYYSFQQSPYVPRKQQTGRLQQTPQVQPPAQISQLQHPRQTTPKPQPYPPFQPSHPVQQVTPQPAPQSTVQFVQPAQQSQSAPKLTAAYTTQQVAPSTTCNLTAVASQQSISRRSSLTRPTPPQSGSGHSRNKSSVSSHSSRFALGSGQRFGTPPSSYGHTRGDSITKSPFSHGFTQPPGLGPSPSPQNGQLFQAQARARSSSLASNISLNTPMTSSAIRPSSSASASTQVLAGHLQSIISDPPKEPRPNIIQKYAFFQVHHNRDATKYRTPYAHWGGFTNGYEGNLRAHLMRTPDALFGIRKQSIGLNSTTPGVSSIPHQSVAGTSAPINKFNDALPDSKSRASHQSSSITPVSVCITSTSLPSPFGPQSTPPIAEPSVIRESSGWHSSSFSESNHWDVNIDAGASLHPAIRAHYAAMLQNRNVKMESQLETGATGQSLATISPSPVVSSTSPNSATLTEAIPQVSPFNQPVSGNRIYSPKSATPIPAPHIPITASTSQNMPGLISSAKIPSATPKQTYIPPPRPWENLQKMRSSTQQSTPHSSIPVTAGTSPALMTSVTQSQPIYSLPEVSRHLPIPGIQPSHVVQSAGFRLSRVQQPESAAIRCSPPIAIQQPPPTNTSTQHSSATSPREEPVSISLSTMKSVIPPTQTVGTPDLPEVSDGSMELVESIIRNAQKASGSLLGTDR
ncbi:hypothetical protein F5Y19DRAFT_413682 [Xylariaceae sp. FL1651]|nr:hypothetical protein F5Y19DRAFT_413682 [Xylariaceae sp. FL1651]